MNSQLQEKYNKYLELLPKVQDEYGFVESHSCDALLFTGLIGCLPEVNIAIMKAFDHKTGMWLRRPSDRPCFDCATNTPTGSASSISRDMLLGLAYYVYHNKRLDISEQVINHAMKNWGFMGRAKDIATLFGRCQIMPSLFSTFCWISYRLGGPSRSWARWVKADTGGHLNDFQAHLQILHILLRKELYGRQKKLSDGELQTIRYQATREPNNPLFLIAAGKYEEAQNILLSESLWPTSRLPAESDRKTHWIPMRDEGKDWAPSIGLPNPYTHSGGDFLFCVWLMDRLKNN